MMYFLKLMQKKKHFFFKKVIKLFGFCLLISLAACNKKQNHNFPAPPVETMKIQKLDVPITFDYAARIAPFKETQVRARVSGILLRRYFQEGSYVKKGDVLFEIEPESYKLAVIRAQAQVAQAKAAYRKAESDAERAQKLVKQNVQSPAFREQALADKMAKKALLLQAEAELSSAKLNLDYTKVTAPIDGITSRDAVAEGSLIGIDVSSSLLTTITQINPVYVNFSYSDIDAKQIKNYLENQNNHSIDSSENEEKKLQVAIFLGDDSLYPELGYIDFTAPTLDSSTGTLSVRAILQNEDHSLTPGQFVRVRVLGIKRPNSIAIPESALMQDGLGSYVFVVQERVVPDPSAKKDEKNALSTVSFALRRDVKVARQLSNRDWLLEDMTIQNMENGQGKKIIGLKDGERILTKGHVRVQSGLTAMGALGAKGIPVRVTKEQKQVLEDVRVPFPKKNKALFEKAFGSKEKKFEKNDLEKNIEKETEKLEFYLESPSNEEEKE